ncbi:MAG TPA: serine/threonine-protein kinase, partial [Kofleriaceae bacterium]|nr:serine/threonine-protein kinase [Kofleriaceae bacterium]
MRPGELIAGRYQCLDLAGRGGMGSVFHGVDRDTDRPVAIKLLNEGALSAQARARLHREAEILGRLDHPRIVSYIAHGDTEAGVPYLVMEWLDGEELSRRLRRGPLGPDEALALARGVVDGLAAAHAAGVVHRDIKPSNLFLRGGDPAAVAIFDFGIARLLQAPRATQTGALVGTPGYLAPEQARGERAIDGRADIFSLGCVLYECLTGRPAFAGEHVMAVLAKILLDDVWPVSSIVSVPRGLDRLISRALTKDPAGRPADGQALAA